MRFVERELIYDEAWNSFRNRVGFRLVRNTKGLLTSNLLKCSQPLNLRGRPQMMSPCILLRTMLFKSTFSSSRQPSGQPSGQPSSQWISHVKHQNNTCSLLYCTTPRRSRRRCDSYVPHMDIITNHHFDMTAWKKVCSCFKWGLGNSVFFFHFYEKVFDNTSNQSHCERSPI